MSSFFYESLLYFLTPLFPGASSHGIIMYLCLDSENNTFCQNVHGAWGGADIEMNTQPFENVNFEIRLLGDECLLHKKNYDWFFFVNDKFSELI